MRIVFVCGCLEPGKDGVGDYVRRLSAELIRRGHYAGAIAFCDKLISHPMECCQHSDDINVPVLRIPEVILNRQRLSLANTWITNFNPQWISLQYVPYSFHQKGIPFFLYKQLLHIGKSHNWHVMFHETWIGKKRLSVKLAVYSWLQKRSIINLFKHIKPKVVHTHLPEYLNQLIKLGLPAKLLPLFSNIAVYNTNNVVNSSNVFRVGFFSQTQVDDCIITFLEQLKKLLEDHQIMLEVLFIGGKNGKANVAATVLNDLSTLKDQISLTGFLEDAELSMVLQTCDLGITSVYKHGLGKSGSVAAFIAHGVPVAAPRTHANYSPTQIGFGSNQLSLSIVSSADLNMIEQARKNVLAAAKQIDITFINEKFLSELIDAS
jgi:glycosyltransferase involved in cell wall biosynthesis